MSSHGLLTVAGMRLFGVVSLWSPLLTIVFSSCTVGMHLVLRKCILSGSVRGAARLGANRELDDLGHLTGEDTSTPRC